MLIFKFFKFRKFSNINQKFAYGLFPNTPDNLILCFNEKKYKAILGGYDLNINCEKQKKKYKYYKQIQHIYNELMCEICSKRESEVFNYTYINDS